MSLSGFWLTFHLSLGLGVIHFWAQGKGKYLVTIISREETLYAEPESKYNMYTEEILQKPPEGQITQNVQMERQEQQINSLSNDWFTLLLFTIRINTKQINY